MRILIWLFRAFLFFSLFAFALNNQQPAAVNWFFGYAWSAPMVFVVLAAFGLGATFGVLAMTPSWWRQRRLALRGIQSTQTTRTPPSPANPSPDNPTSRTDGI